MLIFWLLIASLLLIVLAVLLWPLRNLKKNKLTGLTALIIFIIVPLLSVSLYFYLGASEKVRQYNAIQLKNAQLKTEIEALGSIDNIIAKLEQRVQASPDSQGYMLLGRLYLKAQHFNQAASALAKANALKADQPDILVGYAQSLYLVAQQKLTPQATALLNHALLLQPNQPDAINLLAMAAYQQHDYSKAVNYWEQLLPLVSEGGKAQQQLLQAIAHAQQLAAQAKSGAPTKQATIKLVVGVTLSAAAQSQVSATDTVFIYAQASSETGPPLAIIRKQVRDLPVTVTLDETMAMLPTATLADVKTVKIIARVSKTGQALPAAGDWQASSPIINLSRPPKVIRLEISKQRIN